MTEALTIRLDGADNVAVARVDILPGTRIAPYGVTANHHIPAGHKIALGGISPCDPVRKYNQIIGFAEGGIAPGDHVHTHNCLFGDFERDYAIGQDVRPTDHFAEHERAVFQGFRRDNGRAATRNYIGVLTSVNCSATVARYVADHFRSPEMLAAYPNVDGVVALTHGTGCGMASDGEGMRMLSRTFAGYARHPNFAGLLFIGLGCEAAQLGMMMDVEGLKPGPLLHMFTIQDSGGTTATVKKGIDLVKEMLPHANAKAREPIPASELILGLECGGSDAYSGISANPALGAAADLLVRHGGTACLGETPEIYGAEHLLTRRAVSEEVAQKLITKIHWWEDYVARNSGSMDNNPSPGNKAGGLTTILEKSLGAAAKGGTTNLVDVYSYGEKITARGFVFMDTPGYDPVSVTGFVAGGANVVCFTTGRGSVFGCKPTPSMKLATNTAMYSRLSDDMDINCGLVVDGEKSVQEMGQMIFDRIIEVASGDLTCSERLGFGDDEFLPWQIGAVM
ncbi:MULTISPECIES: altronate dehydratase family protein [unclassified Minwuia]|jgi:arabinonate dehydratase|uniref:UxaA family hydrolase n=1 Tax=unclassified Minwuia TaxID=2618799 RepID=UPI00247AC2A4|nr:MULTISPECIES: altronate dehydratase family protein [unclassified Minwuia]